MNKRGQLTIFIIIAILVVAMVVGFFVFWDRPGPSKVPRNFEPVYNTFLTCIEENLQLGVDALSVQGGYIELPEFEPGSLAFPFSSQLNFVGTSIPYWDYISGGGMHKTQIPTVEDMEGELEEFVISRMDYCNFDSYYASEMTLLFGEGTPKVKIKDGEVVLDLDLDFVASLEGETISVERHHIAIVTKLGSLYEDALKVYEYEQEEMFLEDYGLDVLNLYAPVDGVEFTCAPKVWVADNVFYDIEEALEINTMAMKVGNEKEYFDVEIGTNNDVRFINSRHWPRSFEVNPSEDNILRADPVGNQPGMGILGFCYVSYHFVYNMNYPVLVQVHSGDSNEVFQFPMAVVIQGNRAREPLAGDALGLEKGIDLCAGMNSPTLISVYGNDGNRVEANLSYNCLNDKCYLGGTGGGIFEGNLPQCVNGFILAKAEGYEEGSFMYSSVERGQVNLFLDKLYTLDLNLFMEGKRYSDEAIINFVSEDKVKAVYYPQQKQVELSEGDYEVRVYVYADSRLEFPEMTYEQCYDVPRGPILGYFGATREECVDVEYPEQALTNALVAGGAEEHSISEDQLKSSNVLEINFERFPNPKTISQLQENYILFDQTGVDIKLK